MDRIDKLNNLINNIKKIRGEKRNNSGINFDGINLDNLNIEIVVGSKVDIRSEDKLYDTPKVHLESYLSAIEKYKKYRSYSPKYEIDTLDLNLDINLEIKQKILFKKPVVKTYSLKQKKALDLFNEIQTSVFIYKDIEKTPKYKADFSDLRLDVELEYKKIKEVKKSKKSDLKAKFEKSKKDRSQILIDALNNIERFRKSEKSHSKQANQKLDIDVYLVKSSKKYEKSSKKDVRISILEEKLKRIEEFKAAQRDKKNYIAVNELANNLSLTVELNKKGERVISLSKANKIKKLQNLLKAIESYRENRNEFQR